MDVRKYFYENLDTFKRDEGQQIRKTWLLWLRIVVILSFISSLLSCIFDPYLRSMNPGLFSCVFLPAILLLIWYALTYYFAYHKFGTKWLTFHIWFGFIFYALFFLGVLSSLIYYGTINGRPDELSSTNPTPFMTLLHIIFSPVNIFFLFLCIKLRRLNRYVRALARGL